MTISSLLPKDDVVDAFDTLFVAKIEPQPQILSGIIPTMDKKKKPRKKKKPSEKLEFSQPVDSAKIDYNTAHFSKSLPYTDPSKEDEEFIKLLLTNLPKLSGRGCIAGGFLLRTLTGKRDTINDIDIFFETPMARAEFLTELMESTSLTIVSEQVTRLEDVKNATIKKDEYETKIVFAANMLDEHAAKKSFDDLVVDSLKTRHVDIPDDTASKKLVDLYKAAYNPSIAYTTIEIMMLGKPYVLQLMNFAYGTPTQVIQSFDIGNCMIACTETEIFYIPLCLKATLNKTLVLARITNLTKTLSRILKYSKIDLYLPLDGFNNSIIKVKDTDETLKSTDIKIFSKFFYNVK